MRESNDPLRLEQSRFGLRETVKIVIGGGQIDKEARKYVKADAYGKDALAGVALRCKWIGGRA